MSYKTPMMKIENPKLFYLFRRVFGVLIFFIYNSSFGQIYANGKEIVLGNENPQSVNVIIHVAEGTYIHHPAPPENTAKKKTEKNTSRVHSDKNKKKSNKKHLIAENKRAKNLVQHYYSSTDQNKILQTSHLQKIVFASNSNDFHKKSFTNTIIWNSTNTQEILSSKIIIKIFRARFYHFFDDYKVRPPPFCFVETQKKLKC